jgi:hypothetical protein
LTVKDYSTFKPDFSRTTMIFYILLGNTLGKKDVQLYFPNKDKSMEAILARQGAGCPQNLQKIIGKLTTIHKKSQFKLPHNTGNWAPWVPPSGITAIQEKISSMAAQTMKAIEKSGKSIAVIGPAIIGFLIFSGLLPVFAQLPNPTPQNRLLADNKKPTGLRV